MAVKDFSEVLDLLIKEDTRYAKGAYFFVRQALDHTMKKVQKDKQFEGRGRHISGQELLEGIREYTLEQYGPMGKTLFNEWGIKECQDFGEIVFNLVEYGVLGRTEEDKKEDFSGGYDFHTAFEKPFLPQNAKN